MLDFVYRCSRWSALLGGLVLCALVLTSVASILGRALIGFGLGPVPGDFELVEVGTGVAVFFFMPWCYLRGGHATVDLVYAHLAKPFQWLVVTLSDVLMLLLWLVLTWRLWVGMLEKREYMETSFILQMPLWWGYALCLVGAMVGCLAYLSQTLIQLGLAKPPAGWPVQQAGGH